VNRIRILLLVLSFAVFALAMQACTAVEATAQVDNALEKTADTEQSPEALTSAEASGITPDAAAESQVANTPTEPASMDSAGAATATPDMRLDPNDWRDWPVVPVVSARAKEIVQDGIEKGRDPHVFSKAGDCQNITTYFLAFFEDSSQYRLGAEYGYLQETIYYYDGSFSRESMAVKGGMNVAAVLSPMRANPDYCRSGESPLDCELRLNNPSIMLVSMEEAWGEQNSAANYEKYMRMILDKIIANGTLPIIATKADNLEGDHRINATIAKLAYEYDIPLWNFWRAVQGLPNNGILADGFHLSHGYNQFDNKYALQSGWPVRNLTALQVLDSVRRQLADMR